MPCVGSFRSLSTVRTSISMPGAYQRASISATISEITYVHQSLPTVFDPVSARTGMMCRRKEVARRITRRGCDVDRRLPDSGERTAECVGSHLLKYHAPSRHGRCASAAPSAGTGNLLVYAFGNGCRERFEPSSAQSLTYEVNFCLGSVCITCAVNSYNKCAKNIRIRQYCWVGYLLSFHPSFQPFHFPIPNLKGPGSTSKTHNTTT